MERNSHYPIKILRPHLPTGTKKSHQRILSEQTVSHTRYEPDSSTLQIQCVITTETCSAAFVSSKTVENFIQRTLKKWSQFFIKMVHSCCLIHFCSPTNWIHGASAQTHSLVQFIIVSAGCILMKCAYHQILPQNVCQSTSVPLCQILITYQYEDTFKITHPLVCVQSSLVCLFVSFFMNKFVLTFSVYLLSNQFKRKYEQILGVHLPQTI